MVILVTGGAGFIGSHLVDALVKSKHRVIVVDNLSGGHKKFIHPKAKFYRTDILSSSLEKIFAQEKPEIVFHLAAQKSVPFSVKYPVLDATNNILGSLKLMENCAVFKVKRFVFISTGGAIYGETKILPTPETVTAKPDSPYGLSKLATENYLLEYYRKLRGLNAVVLRLSNVYGPRQDPEGEAGVIAIFVKNLLQRKQCFIDGTGRQTRDFVYMGDVVGACLKALTGGQGIYNIATGKEISINALYHLIAGLTSKAKPKYRATRAGDVFRSVLSFAKAKKELHWRPEINLEQGIKKTIEYFKSL